MAICKCSPEFSNQPHNDGMHQLKTPHKCLIPGCDCQEFQDRDNKLIDAFVKKSH